MEESLNSKKKINVIILAEEPYINVEKNDNKITKISGFTYIVWQEVKHNLHNKYEFNETISENSNYNSVVDLVSKKKYDLAIAPFFISRPRLDKINFSHDFLFEPIVFIHKSRQFQFTTILRYIMTTLIPKITVILILGIVLGYLLSIFEKKRGVSRSILTSIASLFGENGFLSEKWSGKISTIPIILLIFIISYLFGLAMNAYVTAKAVNLKHDQNLKIDDIKNNNFILPKEFSSSMGQMVTDLGGNLIKKDKTPTELLEIVEDSNNEYLGTIMGKKLAEHEIKKMMEKNPEKRNVEISLNLSLRAGCFIVNKKERELLDDINKNIYENKISNDIINLNCKIEYEAIDRYMCSL